MRLHVAQRLSRSSRRAGSTAVGHRDDLASPKAERENVRRCCDGPALHRTECRSDVSVRPSFTCKSGSGVAVIALAAHSHDENTLAKRRCRQRCRK